MGKLIILQGTPYSGKTTWANDYKEHHPNSYVVTEEDFSKYGYSNMAEYAVIESLLSNNCTVISDATNKEPGRFEDLQNIARRTKSSIEVKAFYTPFKTALKEDLRRKEQQLNYIGETLLKHFYLRYYEQEFRKEVYTDPVPVDTYSSDLPSCVICDIDSVVALHQGRDPFNYDLIITDVCNPLVKNLLERFILDGVTVVFITDRPKTHFAHTYEWLAKNFPYYKTDMNTMKKFYKWDLLMSKASYIKSEETKKELYETYVKGKYNVLAVFDGNAKMWEKEGLLTCQINKNAED